MINFASFFIILGACCVCQEYSPKELSKFLPNDAVELTVDGAELADSETIVTRELGTLKTGLTYYFKLPVFNLTDIPVTIERINSSCGCLTAIPASADKVMSIEPKRSSPILVIVKPQFADSTYEKLIKIEALNGKKLRLGVVGKFVAPLSLKTTSFVLDGRNRKFVTELDFLDGWDLSKLSIDDPTKMVSVLKSTAATIEIEVTDKAAGHCDATGGVSYFPADTGRRHRWFAL